MAKKFKFTGMFILFTCLLLLTVNSVFVERASANDEYDELRERWKVMLTGGTSYNPADPDIAAQITALTAEANAHWSSMDTTPGTYLWSDLASTSDPSHITQSYGRLKTMAIAYATTGSALHNDASLLADIQTGLDWMYANRYNETATKYGNWWDWEIGAPMALNDIAVLLYDQLTSTQLTNYMNAVDHFQPTITMSGANRTWECTVIAIRGIIVKSSAKLSSARDGLSQVFHYATSGDGFYKDGSFIQHNRHPYTGGYGTGLMLDSANLIYLLHDSSWEVTDTDVNNVYQWVYEAFEPLVYKGAMMDLSRGREISRSYIQDHDRGHRVMSGVIRISQFAPTADATAFRSMVKEWMESDTHKDFFADASVDMIVLAKEIKNNAASRGELIKNKQYPNMARAVHLRPGFGFGISMSSNRIYNYESINAENRKGWYTGDGMTYLYNLDLSQYTDDFWPTVNPYRLPGTTVDTQTRSNSSGESYLGAANWAGGTSILGTYGVSGMELDAWNSDLTAKKSWFMFDDEVVALGAGITNTGQTGNGWDGTARKVETIVENRKLNGSGNNALTVNGTAKSTAIGWSETMTGVNWAHLAGNVSGSDIGYYFPGGATVIGLREARTGKWSQIDARSGTPTADITSRYLNLWLDHGVNPTNASYSYVLLPGKTSAQVNSYAGNPNVTILENSTSLQAVKEESLNIVGMNFWNDGLKWVQVDASDFVSSNKKASVMTKENEGHDIEIAVSDPTMSHTGSIQIEINRSATSKISADDGVTITQLSPTIKLSINVNGSRGKTFKAKFSLDGTPIPDTILLEAEDLNAATSPGAAQNDYANEAASGGWYNSLNANAAGAFIEYTVNIPEAGTYTVYAMDRTANNKGIYQLTVDSVNVGSAVDQYSGTTGFRETNLGQIVVGSAGNKSFRFTVTGKNGASSNYTLGFDFIKLVKATASPPTILEAEDLNAATSPGAAQNDYANEAASGGWYNSLNATAAGAFIEYTVNIPEAGTYTVYAMDRTANNKGIYQLTVDSVNVGPAVDQYSGTTGFRETNLGQIVVGSAGNKSFRFTVTGKNGASSNYTLGFDYMKLVKN